MPLPSIVYLKSLETLLVFLLRQDLSLTIATLMQASLKPQQAGPNSSATVLPQPPNLLELQICITTPGLTFLFNHVSMWVPVRECWCLQRPEDGAGSPGAGVSGSYKLPAMGVKSCPGVLSLISMHC